MNEYNGPLDPQTGETIKIHKFMTLASTNLEAGKWFQQGQSSPFWIVADEQSAGRGRQGRIWQSEAGNLFTTTGRRFQCDPANLASLSLVTGIALYDAIMATTATPLNLTLKWPNDLLCNNAKLGGILIESQKSSTLSGYDIAIGIGVNIKAHPVVKDRETISLSALGANVTRDAVLNALTEKFETWLSVWAEGAGLNRIITAWSKRAAPLNTPISVKLGHSKIEGRYAGLDETGALKLKLEDNSLKLITGGEVL